MVTFSSCSKNADHWSWNYSDGNYSIGKEAVTTHSFASPGLYPVRLIAYSKGEGKKDEEIVEVTVKQPMSYWLSKIRINKVPAYTQVVDPGEPNPDVYLLIKNGNGQTVYTGPVVQDVQQYPVTYMLPSPFQLLPATTYHCYLYDSDPASIDDKMGEWSIHQIAPMYHTIEDSREFNTTELQGELNIVYYIDYSY